MSHSGHREQSHSSAFATNRCASLICLASWPLGQENPPMEGTAKLCTHPTAWVIALSKGYDYPCGPQLLQGLLTLFPESFSPFVHTTCALSIPHPYSALTGIHLPIRAAIPRSSTHWALIQWHIWSVQRLRGFHPVSHDIPVNLSSQTNAALANVLHPATLCSASSRRSCPICGLGQATLL